LEHKEKIVFSEPVREIMGTPPRKLIAVGTSLLFALFILFLLAAWYIEYPDIVPVSIEITSRYPPVTMTSRVNGRIVELMVPDKGKTLEGDLLAVLESSADYREVLELEAFILKGMPDYTLHDSVPPLAALGELQQPYTVFRQAGSRLTRYRVNDYLGHRVDALREEIRSGQLFISSLKEKEKLFHDNLEVEYALFRRDSILKSSRFISENEYDKSYQSLLARRIEIQQMNLDILSETISLTRKEQEVQDLLIRREEELQELESQASGAMADLLAAVDIWKSSYLLISPVDGTVNYSRFWSSGQYVYEGEAVLSVVPDLQGELIGRVILGMQKSGKVNPGLLVNIKLDGYPFLEYGIISGVVASISSVAENKGYIAEVSLPDGLRTAYGQELPFIQNMSGTAEIMTDKLNLLEKIFGPVKYLVYRNRTVREDKDH
jgi:HlyD family secretion protein